MYFNDYEVKYGQAVHTHTGARKQNKNPMQDDACVNVPALLSSPTYDVSSTFYCTLGTAASHHLRLLVGCLPLRCFHLGDIRWENITI